MSRTRAIGLLVAAGVIGSLSALAAVALGLSYLWLTVVAMVCVALSQVQQLRRPPRP